MISLNPLMLATAQNQPDNFGDIFQAKEYLEKYLKEKYLSEPYH